MVSFVIVGILFTKQRLLTSIIKI